MSATGNFVDARTALEWGLVNHVVPHGELASFAQQLAADVATNDPAAVAALFATYRECALVTGAEARDVEARAHRAWHPGGFAGGQVAERRAAVVERGRAQVAD